MKRHIVTVRRCQMSGAVAALLLTAMVGQHALAQSPPAGPSIPAPGTVNPTQDIREIRGPKPVMSPWLIPLIALSSLLSGAAGWAAWTWYRRRPGLFLQTPAEIALARLEYARGLMAPELGREFSIEVSSAVREYIESRFRVMAAHLTTHEFLHDLLRSGDPLLADNESSLAEFLKFCDLGKFGGWNLSLHDREGMLATARRFIVASAADTRVLDGSVPSADAPGPSADAPGTATRSSTSSSSTTVLQRETYDSLPST